MSNLRPFDDAAVGPTPPPAAETSRAVHCPCSSQMSSDGNGESVSIALQILAIVLDRTFSPFITRSIVRRETPLSLASARCPNFLIAKRKSRKRLREHFGARP